MLEVCGTLEVSANLFMSFGVIFIMPSVHLQAAYSVNNCKYRVGKNSKAYIPKPMKSFSKGIVCKHRKIHITLEIWVA